MGLVSNRAIVMPPFLAALVSLSLVLQLCVSGCAVGPSYRKPATTLENFHGVGALAARPTRVPAPALEAWWDGFNDPMLSSLVQRLRRSRQCWHSFRSRLQCFGDRWPAL